MLFFPYNLSLTNFDYYIASKLLISNTEIYKKYLLLINFILFSKFKFCKLNYFFSEQFLSNLQDNVYITHYIHYTCTFCITTQ